MVRRRNVAACLALILLCGAMPVSVYATEETKQLINQAEQEKKDTENKLNETEQNLKGLNEQKDSLQGTLTTLNTELSQVSNNLNDLEGKITDKEAEIEALNQKIEQINKELEEAIQLKDDQYDSMKKQIKFLYERSDALYLELFFSSGSFSDFLNKTIILSSFRIMNRRYCKAIKMHRLPWNRRQQSLNRPKRIWKKIRKNWMITKYR